VTLINIIAIILGILYNSLGCDFTALGQYWYITVAETSLQSVLILIFAMRNIKLIRKYSENLLNNENQIVRDSQGEER
jgi:hypothetical protein